MNLNVNVNLGLNLNVNLSLSGNVSRSGNQNLTKIKSKIKSNPPLSPPGGCGGRVPKIRFFIFRMILPTFSACRPDCLQRRTGGLNRCAGTDCAALSIQRARKDGGRKVRAAKARLRAG